VKFLIFGREKLTVLIMCLRPEGTRGSSNYVIMCCWMEISKVIIGQHHSTTWPIVTD